MRSPTLLQRVQNAWVNLRSNRRLIRLAGQTSAADRSGSAEAPVAFFNASTRLGGISQNAAFASLSSLALQQAGVPVVHFACRAGMSRCVLGTVINGAEQPPPCRTCRGQTEVLTANAPTHWFEYRHSQALENALHGLDIAALTSFVYQDMPLGALCLPAMRWALRRHHLSEDEPTRRLYRRFIQSAWSLAIQFSDFLEQTGPRAVVLFNGVMYPEAMVRYVARQHELPVICHEVAHQPLSAFFSHGEVTAYPVRIPADFELSPAQSARLDAYLEERFQGRFSMAGVEFWPQMQSLDDRLQAKIAAHRQLVPVFTNVIFDTSQIHANTLFEHMFAWLDQIGEMIRAHPDTLFVVRAHPDELRPNSRKQSKETVDEWIRLRGLGRLPNVVYINPLEYLSSYALIQRAKFVMVYNSTIGLEAALMNRAVLNGGQARYTQVRCVFLPQSAADHRRMAESFLAASEVQVPAEFSRNARRFQYYQLWRTPLPFGDFMEAHPTRGYVQLKPFALEDLHPDRSVTMRVIADGILQGTEFVMPEPASSGHAHQAPSE